MDICNKLIKKGVRCTLWSNWTDGKCAAGHYNADVPNKEENKKSEEKWKNLKMTYSHKGIIWRDVWKHLIVSENMFRRLDFKNVQAAVVDYCAGNYLDPDKETVEHIAKQGKALDSDCMKIALDWDTFVKDNAPKLMKLPGLKDCADIKPFSAKVIELVNEIKKEGEIGIATGGGGGAGCILIPDTVVKEEKQWAVAFTMGHETGHAVEIMVIKKTGFDVIRYFYPDFRYGGHVQSREYFADCFALALLMAAGVSSGTIIGQCKTLFQGTAGGAHPAPKVRLQNLTKNAKRLRFGK